MYTHTIAERRKGIAMEQRIYGWSYSNSTGDQYMVRFDTVEEADKWLHTEEYDFRDRQLLTRDEASGLMGDAFAAWDEEFRTDFCPCKPSGAAKPRRKVAHMECTIKANAEHGGKDQHEQATEEVAYGAHRSV